jgi:hypothetical protein
MRRINQNAARTAFLINGFAFEAPPVPVLLQILSGAKKASDLVPAGSIYGLKRDKSVELTMPAGALGGPVSIPFQHLATRPHLFGYARSLFTSIQFTYMVMRST